VNGSAKARLKRAVFDHLPAMTVAEAVESRLRRRALAATRASEDREVAHALDRLGARIRADVVTVIATYRRPQLLQVAVASALAQPVDDHAVLIIDDGAGGVPSFDDPRVHVLNLTTNLGICGVVRNVGIRISDSPYLAFLDDDNRWEPDHLTRSLAGLENGAVFSYSGVRVVTPAGDLVHTSCEPFDRRVLRHRNYVDSSTIVAPRTPSVIFSRLRRPRGTARHEDWELAYRLSRIGRVGRVDAVTVEYLDNPDSHYRNITVADASG
jgi:GT2 family glycosyltransferase